MPATLITVRLATRLTLARGDHFPGDGGIYWPREFEDPGRYRALHPHHRRILMPQTHTVIEDRRYKRIEWGSAPLPPCQAGYMGEDECTKPGEFDAPTPQGPWADLCEEHEKTLAKKGSELGYHRIRHA